MPTFEPRAPHVPSTGGARRPGKEPLPRPYLLWLAGILASLAGNAVFFFALGWAAGAHGGAVAGLVLSAVTLPRVLLLLVGGVVSDRFSARSVLIAGDAAMFALSLALAAAACHWGAPPALLLLAALAVGVADAFYLPASGSMPRRLVADGQLSRALSLRQIGGQLIAMGGAPLGALLVGIAGLTGAALVNAATFAATLIVLIIVRPLRPVPAVTGRTVLLAEARDGVRVALAHPVLRPGLLLTGAAAGFLLPVASVLLPLLARAEGWGVTAAGLVVGAQGAGMAVVTLAVVVRGPLGRPGRLAVSGLGVAGLGLTPGAPGAVAAGLVMGAGSGIFAAHIAPLVLAVAPETHLSRVQALLVLLQSLALLLMTNVLGAVADLASPRAAVLTCALATTGVAMLGLASRALRTDRTGPVAS